MNTKGTFRALDKKDKLFVELKNNAPDWWNEAKNDKELYIEVRKDNYINIYYYGGSVAKISYRDNKICAESHYKYLNGKKIKAESQTYQICTDILEAGGMNDIKESIKEIFLKDNSKNRQKLEKDGFIEKSEKKVQGQLILREEKYIDSEMEYLDVRKDELLRIDLVELINGNEIKLVELKLAHDSRLLSQDNVKNPPEIIKQMEKYKRFISSQYNINDIKNYYRTLLEIKQNLGLPFASWRGEELRTNTIPKLLLADTYSRSTDGRSQRMESIKELLENKGIEFEVFELGIVS